MMKMNLYRISGLLCALLTGCTGMHLGDGDMRIDRQENAAIEADYQNRATLIQISASMLVAQAVEKQKIARIAQNLILTPQLAHEYLVGPQDVLQVTVWDHPELTIPGGQQRSPADSGNLVRLDGTTFYPYIGVVSVAGKTLEEIRQLFTEKLARYIEKPQVDVRVAAYRSQKVHVTGEVAKPGMQPITDRPLHVLEAIQIAGGVRSTGQLVLEADLERVKLTRSGEVHNINVLTMLLDGDLSNNMLLRNGDVLHVSDNFSNKVFVMGEVRNPKTQLIHKGHMSLAEALGDAGGLNSETSNASQIYVIRGGELVDRDAATGSPEQLAASFKPTVYRLDASSADALILADQFELQAHDVVFVSAAPIVRWGRVLNQLQGTLSSYALINALMKR